MKHIILLVNLGSPDLLSTRAIREFLGRFLRDKRVVNLPKLLWLPILYGLILPFRARRLLQQYQKIWLESGSPLVHYTKEQAQKLANLISYADVEVMYAFSYATPTVNMVLDKAHYKYNISSLTVIPLYPQFSSTTTAVVFDDIADYYRDKYFLPQLRILNEFHAHSLYIQAVANSIRQSWQSIGRSEKLIFSFHSLPENIIKRGDAYYTQCCATTQLIVKELGLTETDYTLAFQSKFGKQRWISPLTINVLTDLGKSNVKSIDVICPGFVSDCLETLEEIAVTNKAAFLAAGGEKYNYIGCLNSRDEFIQLLYNLINLN